MLAVIRIIELPPEVVCWNPKVPEIDWPSTVIDVVSWTCSDPGAKAIVTEVVPMLIPVGRAKVAVAVTVPLTPALDAVTEPFPPVSDTPYWPEPSDMLTSVKVTVVTPPADENAMPPVIV